MSVLLQVLKAVGQANKNVPAGSVESSELDIPVEMKGRFKSLDEIRNLVIFKQPDYGIAVKIKDVAEVFETQKAGSGFFKAEWSTGNWD